MIEYVEMGICFALYCFWCGLNTCHTLSLYIYIHIHHSGLYELTTIRSALEWLVLLSGTAQVVPGVARPLTASPAGTTSAVPDSSTTPVSADRINGQFLYYHDHKFTKSKGNLRFRRLFLMFVPIGVRVMTHSDGTASDVTIGM